METEKEKSDEPRVKMDDKRSEEIKSALGAKSTTKLPDFSKTQQQKNTSEDTKTGLPEKTPENLAGADLPFTLEDAKNAVSKFSELRKEEGKIQEQSLYKQTIYLEDEKTIILPLNNSVQEDILGEVLQELVLFLRKELKNNSVILRSELTKNESEAMIYTNKEKFEHLASKNPLVKEMQEKLGLDPDF